VPAGNADTPRPAALCAGAPAKSSEQVMPTHKAGRQGTEVEVIACARAFHSPLLRSLRLYQCWPLDARRVALRRLCPSRRPRPAGVTFYLSLPASTAGLDAAAAKAAMPGSSTYRHFTSLATAASQFGATDAQINAVAGPVQSLGLEFAADPTRLFARVTGTAKQWQAALGTPLTEKAATASNPFTSYTLPAKTPAALQPSGAHLLLDEAEVYDPAANGNQPSAGDGLTPAARTAAAKPWPLNTGTPAWFYQAAAHSGAFYDVTTGDNDLAGVGCCQAAVGYDLASGIGVPNWAVLPATLPPPG
jgi:hypothetical protein